MTDPGRQSRRALAVLAALLLLAATGCGVTVDTEPDDSVNEEGVEESVEKDLTEDPKLPGEFREADCTRTEDGGREFRCLVTMENLPQQSPDCTAIFALTATVDEDAETVRYELPPFSVEAPTFSDSCEL